MILIGDFNYVSCTPSNECVVLCHKEGNAAGSQHLGERCSLCHEYEAQAASTASSQLYQGQQTQRHENLALGF